MYAIFDGIEYIEGDRIQFIDDGDEYLGRVRFGIYDDDEGYTTFEHLGFYVEYKHKFWKEGLELSTATLPDVITQRKGKLI